MLKLFLGTVAGAAWGGGGSIGLEIATAGVGGVGGEKMAGRLTAAVHRRRSLGRRGWLAEGPHVLAG